MRIVNFLFLFYPFFLFAEDKCKQIPSLTCSPGELDDGTGSLSMGPSNGEKEDLFFANQREGILNRFSQELKKASDEDLQLALQATGVGSREDCAFSQKGLPESCQKLLASGLTERLIMDLKSGNTLRSDEESESLVTEYSLRQSHLYQKVYQPVYENAYNTLKNPEALKRVENVLFPKAKDRIKDLITQHIKDPKQRNAFLFKINSISFAGDNCDINNNQNLSNEFSPNAYYQPSSSRFYFCSSMLRQGMSDYMAIHTIAHELAHSIDPCQITKGARLSGFEYKSQTLEEMEKEFPFGSLLSCLRDSKSVGALPAAIENPSENPFCDDGEQICESFADWIANETLLHYTDTELKSSSPEKFQLGLANVWRTFCPSSQVLPFEGDDSNHPPTGRRLTKLLLTHPSVRKRLNCSELDPSKDIYCDPGSYSKPEEVEPLDGTENREGTEY